MKRFAVQRSPTRVSHALPNPGAHARRGVQTDRLAFALAAVAVFLSPYNYLRLPFAYITASDLAVLALFFLLFTTRRLPLAPLGQLTPIWFCGYLALVGGMLVGSIANTRMTQSAEVFAQYSFAMVVLPMAISRQDMAEARRLLMVFAVSMVLVMAHGFYLMEFASNPPINFVTPAGRLRGVVERANALSALAAVAVVVTMYLSAERLLPRAMTIAFIAVLLFGILLTASNTGLIAVTAGVTVFTIFQATRRHFVTIALLVALGVGALLIGGESILPASFMKRVAGALSSGDLGQAGTFSDRLDLLLEGWHASREHVLVGMGAEGFREISSHEQPVHNTYVLLLVEGGVMSLAGLCVLLSATFFTARSCFCAPTPRMSALSSSRLRSSIHSC